MAMLNSAEENNPNICGRKHFMWRAWCSRCLYFTVFHFRLSLIWSNGLH